MQPLLILVPRSNDILTAILIVACTCNTLTIEVTHG